MSGEESSLNDPPRIERTPDAISLSIERLVEQAREGRLRVPEFQRRFKWKNEDKVALFDSIERGYPIGTLLLWKRRDHGTGGYFEGVTPSGQLSDTPYWLVDGQQRITTLFKALAVKPREDEPFLVFDLRMGQFRFVRSGTADSEAVPLHVLLDATELSEWLVGQKWPPERMRRAFDLGKRIRQYAVPAYVVEAEDERVVKQIFDRTNSTGKALTRDEVFDAFAAMIGGPDGVPKGIDVVNERLASLRFGALQRGTILNAVEATHEVRIGEMSLQDVTPERSDAWLETTASALRGVIGFLRSSAHVPHAALVPYELPIVVLARFFGLFPKPTERSRILLRRWLWRASLRQSLGGASGSLQEHVSDVRDDEHASVQRLLARTGGGAGPVSMDLRRPLSIAAALGRLQVCAMLGAHLRDLVTGELLEPGELFAQGMEKAIRRIVGRIEGEEPLLRTMANRLVHPVVPGTTPARLLVSSRDPGALVSHGVDEAALEALRGGDARRFLSLRVERLDVIINGFAARHAEWGADDSPALSALRRSA